MEKRFIVITGPTAVGKTDIAYALQQHYPIEIINADVGQMYTPLTIGTAKPDVGHLGIAHHLFNCLNEPTSLTVTEYRRKLVQVLDEVWQRKRMPVVVGGSGFYIRSIFFPPLAQAAPQASVHGSWQELHAVDPRRAEQIHPNDQYRIDRALAIWHATGKPPSQAAPQFLSPAPFHCSILIRERAELYQRIDARVIQMLNAGWIEEVKHLIDTPWEPWLAQKKIIGYDSIIAHLRGTLQYDQMVKNIQQHTRNYAKRQMTFFRLLGQQLAPHSSMVMCTGRSDEEIVNCVRSAPLL